MAGKGLLQGPSRHREAFDGPPLSKVEGPHILLNPSSRDAQHTSVLSFFPDLTQHLSKAEKIALHTEPLDKHRTAPPSMHLPLRTTQSGHFTGAKVCHPIPMALNPSHHAVLLLREKSEKSVCVPCIFATSHPGLASKDEHGSRAAHVTWVMGVEAAWGPSPSSSQ